MFKTFDGICNDIKKQCEFKYKDFLYCTMYGDFFKKFFIFMLIIIISSMYLSNVLMWIVMILLLIWFIRYLLDRRVYFGMGTDSFVLAHTAFLGKISSITEILKDNIRYISYKKFLFFHMVNITFIDVDGKLKNKKMFYYNMGLNTMGALKISKTISDMQKVFDRGDF
ncbi:MAG: hypothetical protein ACI4WW_03055 [Candidatus Coprovivens sp.]